jgi:hypothetical protein
MCDQYDLSVHQAISPNKMPPDFNESLRNLGLSTNQPEPPLVDVNARDIISLNIDHHQGKIVTQTKQ